MKTGFRSTVQPSGHSEVNGSVQDSASPTHGSREKSDLQSEQGECVNTHHENACAKCGLEEGEGLLNPCLVYVHHRLYSAWTAEALQELLRAHMPLSFDLAKYPGDV